MGGSMTPAFASALLKQAKLRGSYFSKQQLAAMIIPNTTASLSCYAWQHDHFDNVGDFMPNTDGEVHLEPTEMQSVWEEYYSGVQHIDLLVVTISYS